MGLQSSTPVKREGKAITYVPSIQSLLVPKNDTEGKRVLVVGAGCAGLGAAWHLHRAGVDVTLYEALGKLGGHANTINGKYPLTLISFLVKLISSSLFSFFSGWCGC